MEQKFLDPGVIQQVQEVFEQLHDPVQVLFFGKQTDCDYCGDTLQLVEEVVEISDKLALTVYDVEANPEIARQYQVDKTPGLVLAGRDGDQLMDYGIRFAGIPFGHEFASLIHDLVLVSGRDSGLSQRTREALKSLSKPVKLQVFVTPT